MQNQSKTGRREGLFGYPGGPKVITHIFKNGDAYINQRWETQEDLDRQVMAQAWWCITLMPAIRTWGLWAICEFEASLVYKAKFQDSQSCYLEKLCLKKTNPQAKTKKKQPSSNQTNKQKKTEHKKKNVDN